MRKLLKKISDLKNAYRVLEIMDKAGCDIEQVSNMNGYYKLEPKWYVSERDAKDLQKIVLHKKIIMVIITCFGKFGLKIFVTDIDIYN